MYNYIDSIFIVTMTNVTNFTIKKYFVAIILMLLTKYIIVNTHFGIWNINFTNVLICLRSFIIVFIYLKKLQFSFDFY